MKGRGGYIKNIDFENLSFKNVRKIAIKLTFRYNAEPLDDQNAPVTDVPDLSSISVKNLKCERANYGAVIQGIKNFPLREIYLEDVDINAYHASIIEDVQGLYTDNVKIHPIDSPPDENGTVYVHDV